MRGILCGEEDHVAVVEVRGCGVTLGSKELGGARVGTGKGEGGPSAREEGRCSLGRMFLFSLSGGVRFVG